MYIADRKEYVERREAGFLFWLLWVAATTLGAFAGHYLEGQVLMNATLPGAFDILAVATGGAVTGAVIGLAQAIVLMPYLKRRGAIEWLVATILGRIAGAIPLFLYADALSGLFLSNEYATLCGLIIMRLLLGGLLGLLLAYPQYLVLKHRSEKAKHWLLANTAISMVTTYISALTIGIPYGLVTGVVTGYVLAEVLRSPTDRAEWRVRVGNRD